MRHGMLDREMFVKAYALDRVLEHLRYNLTHETRKRELLRTKVAMRTLGKWLKMGEEAYGQQIKDN